MCVYVDTCQASNYNNNNNNNTIQDTKLEHVARFLVLVFLAARAAALLALAAAGSTRRRVPIVDHLGADDSVGQRGDDVSGDDGRVARLLDRREDARHGAGEQQKHRHGRQLARAARAVVGHGLDQLQTRRDKNKNIYA